MEIFYRVTSSEFRNANEYTFVSLDDARAKFDECVGIFRASELKKYCVSLDEMKRETTSDGKETVVRTKSVDYFLHGAKRMSDDERAVNAERWKKIQSMPRDRYAYACIGCYWDDLNAQYRNHGCDEEFAMKRKSLKKLIKSFIGKGYITKESFDEWTRLPWNMDYMSDGKFYHGYNFNYK